LFTLKWAGPARKSFESLKADSSKQKQYKAVKNALRKLAQDPFYPGLQSHPFNSLNGPSGEKVFESYAENRTPGAYRIFWYYESSERGIIMVFLIAQHP
jgi:hypothetical protein